jgi:hypothetical protein
MPPEADARPGGPALDVSVVVPVYDNAPTLRELCARLAAVLEAEGLAFEILCVDDASRDGSWGLLRELRAGDARIRPVQLSRNFGQAAALSAGFDRARGRVVVTIDADLQNLPEDVPLLLAEMKRGHDLVSGVRTLRDDPRLARRLPSWVANRMVQWMVGVPLHDVGCGLNALTRTLARELARYGEMRRFLKPLAASLARSVGEVRVRHAREPGRPAGHSRYSLLSLLSVQLDFFTSFSRKPFQLIGLVGVALLLLGLLAGTVTLGLWLGPGVSVGSRAQTLVILAVLVGSQLAVLGLLGEFIVRIHHAQSQPFYVVRSEADGAGAADDGRATADVPTPRARAAGPTP